MLPGESANHKLACHVDYWWSSADEDRLEVITSGVAVLQLMSVSSGTTAEAHSAAVTVNTTEKVTVQINKRSAAGSFQGIHVTEKTPFLSGKH